MKIPGGTFAPAMPSCTRNTGTATLGASSSEGTIVYGTLTCVSEGPSKPPLGYRPYNRLEFSEPFRLFRGSAEGASDRNDSGLVAGKGNPLPTRSRAE